MPKTKYYDVAAVMQVIGNVFENPNLLDMDEKYHFNGEDFYEEFHRILFGSIYNLHQLGVKKITIPDIESYLAQRPQKFGTYTLYKGSEYLTKLKDIIQPAAFDYHYKRLKKMTLMRMYEDVGMNLSWLYDTNDLNLKTRQEQEERFDNMSIEEIADIIDKKISEIRMSYVDNFEGKSVQAGSGLQALLQRLKETPEIGYPLYGDLINSILRGARLKKFYLRSAATGVGKSRSMIADACSIACGEIFDLTKNCWVSLGVREPTIFISTEQEIDEIQTMMLAFLSGVDEDHILNNTFGHGEEERVIHASSIIENSPLYIEQLPNFGMRDIENTIKRAIHDHDVRYVFYDYLHSSLKILEEVSSRAGVKGLREDNVLFMISTRLKDICNQYGVFIMSGTQLNADYVTAKEYDQNLLRGR